MDVYQSATKPPQVISLLDRIVWSALVRASRIYQDGRHQSDISKLLGMNADKTVRPALARLRDLNLVEKLDDGAWRAVAPTDEILQCFRQRRAKTVEGAWWDDLAYTRMYLPTAACPLTLKQLAVYFVMLGLVEGKGGESRLLSAEYLSLVVGVHPKTVVATLKLLVSHKLLRCLGTPRKKGLNSKRFAVLLSEVPDACLGWFQDRGRAKPELHYVPVDLFDGRDLHQECIVDMAEKDVEYYDHKVTDDLNTILYDAPANKNNMGEICGISSLAADSLSCDTELVNPQSDVYTPEELFSAFATL